MILPIAAATASVALYAATPALAAVVFNFREFAHGGVVSHAARVNAEGLTFGATGFPASASQPPATPAFGCRGVA